METKEVMIDINKHIDNLISKEDQIIELKKKRNLSVYPLYRIFSWDLLFYYAIIYLFLTIQKGISPAEILQFDACYIFFKFLVQIPCTLMIEKIGKRKSLIIANFVATIHIVLIMIAPNFEILLISQFLCAFAYIIKNTCESDMLYDSIEHGEKRGIIFAKIDGKANSKYYYIDAISAILSGLLFVINPYIPMTLCTLTLLGVTILSTKFEELHGKTNKIYIKDELKNIRNGFRSIFKSNRLKSLLIFNGIFIAFMRILSSLRNNILLEIGMPEQYFGVIFAVMGIITGIAARYQGKIHKRYRNKTLAFLSLPTTVSCLILGFVLMFNLPNHIAIPIILLLFAIQYIMKGPYYILIKQYFNNFTTSDKRVKIATTNNLCENIIAAILMFGASYILNFLSLQYYTIIIGCIGIILIVLLLDKMRTRVGLKMEEYGKKEII